ncbi:MAG: hypothetical protein NVSMB46_04670 [Candidatus Saccharimonadales bacterium]
MENKPENNTQLDSLENADTKVESTPQNASPATDSNSLESSSASNTSIAPIAVKKKKFQIRNVITHLNIYLLLFILVVVIAVGIVFIGFQRNKKETVAPTINNKPLTQEELNKLKNSDTSIGDAKQTLNIESNAVFAGRVLVKDGLDVAGTLRIGGALNLPGITVSGTSTFDLVQANKLAITGDTNVAGQLTVQKGVTVSGGGTFGGPISAPQLTIQNLQLSGDLQINRHIQPGGVSPGKTDGSALGGGGTSSVSGSDTAGTVSINTGNSPAVGCFITVNFINKFNATPHVIVSPVGSSAGSLNFYTIRSTSSFSICTNNPAPSSSSFSFDYIALD